MTLADVADDLDRLCAPVTLGDLFSACRARGFQGHMVVLREPYLGRILSGTKTIESRFSRHRIPPFQCVASGDVLILKKSGGPILAVADAVRTEFYGPLKHVEILRILERHRRQLQWDDSFPCSIQGARYATLVHLGAVARIRDRRVLKSDLRGWVVLTESDQAVGKPRQMQLPLEC